MAQSETIYGRPYVHMRRAEAEEYGLVIYAPGIGQAVPSQHFFNQLIRVAEHQIIFDPNVLGLYRDLKMKRSGLIIWDKSLPGEVMPHTAIYCSNLLAIHVTKYGWTPSRQGESITNGGLPCTDPSQFEQRVHKYQVPVEMWVTLLSQFRKGITVLDVNPCGGSARIAADMLGMGYVGIEAKKADKLANDKRYDRYKRAPELPLGVERLPVKL